MTYGFSPDNWWIFDQEFRVRGITVSEIERVRFEPKIRRGMFPSLW